MSDNRDGRNKRRNINLKNARKKNKEQEKLQNRQQDTGIKAYTGLS